MDGERTAWKHACARRERLRRALAAAGFRPAFFDFATATLYPSCHADGMPAEGHELDGLPDSVVAIRTTGGRVLAARATLRPGYERGGFFFTRSSARRALREWRTTEDDLR
jgi:hypothetical protein